MAAELSVFEELKKYGIIAGMVISSLAWLDSRNEKIYQKMEEYHLAVIAIDKKTDIIEQDVAYLKQGLFSELTPSKNIIPPIKTNAPYIPLSYMPHYFLFFDEKQNSEIIASL
jgi:ribosomal protein S1